MSIPSRPRPPLPLERAADELSDALFYSDPPFFGREELNPWRPAFDSQLSTDVEDQDGAEDDFEYEDISRRRVLRGIPPAPVPVLAQRLRPVVDSLSAELARETDGLGRFQTVTPVDSIRAAETCDMYRSKSLDIIRRAGNDSRRMFL